MITMVWEHYIFLAFDQFIFFLVYIRKLMISLLWIAEPLARGLALMFLF